MAKVLIKFTKYSNEMNKVLFLGKFNLINSNSSIFD